MRNRLCASTIAIASNEQWINVADLSPPCGHVRMLNHESRGTANYAT